MATKIQKFNYRKYEITFAENNYWFAGEPFTTRDEAERSIDEYLDCEPSGYDDSADQRDFEDYWQNK
jgi:hypothetical protein